ncbi:Plasmid stabilization system protein [Phycisphaerae bacterium RAS1]|nr:Plasmid stabilization system protein [Phycisphaerae bacterium RAS1]
MARQVRWVSEAIDDLDAIAAYISRDSPTHAAAVVSRMIAAAAELALFPLSCRRVPEWDDDAVRQRIVYSYRLIFRIKGDVIEILAVIHGARMLPDDTRDRG